MLLTPHAAVGAAIGASTENIPLIIILGILSHFLLDAIPHFDWGTWHFYEPDFKLETKDYVLLAGDVILASSFVLWVWSNYHSVNMMIGTFSAVLVDLIDNVPFWKHQVRKTVFGKILHFWHRKLHFLLKPKLWYLGVLTQLVIIVGSIWVIIVSH